MKLPIDTDIFPEKAGVYVVGGPIRDLLSGRKPFDYDLAIRQDTELFARRLAAKTSGHVVKLGKHEFKMMRVVAKDHFFDIMPLSGDDIISDLHSRDFSINAMAMEVSSGNLIDPLGGQADLAAKKVRMVSREVFRHDPLRLVRAYRMAAAFDFSIDKDTKAAIAADANLIQESAGERIREELFKILQSIKSHVYLSMMAQSGLLFSVFPEFLQLNQLRLNPGDPRTVFEQTLDSYHHLEKRLNPDDEFMRSSGVHFKDGYATRSMLLKWSLLFHDLGIPPTNQSAAKAEKSDHNARAAASAATAQKICKRLRFSRRQTETIELIILQYFKPYVLFRDHKNNEPIEKAFIRFFLDCGDITPEALMLALADFMGKNDPHAVEGPQFEAFIGSLIRRYYTLLLPRAALPAPISGQDLINEFGMKPSAKFKHILSRVEEERLAKDAYTREEALKLVKDLLER
jgi:tRNA nucleotidyltransferase/poly(A) polymerase